MMGAATVSSPNVHQLPPGQVEDVDPADAAEREAREVQALSEGVVLDGDKVECMGKWFRVADKIGLMPLMKFAHVASKDVDSGDMDGLAAIYDMLKDCLAAEEWNGFVQHMIDTKADAEDMMPVVRKTIEIINARPTQPRSGSSSGSHGTTPTSTDGSSSPARRPAGVEDLVPAERLASAG